MSSFRSTVAVALDVPDVFEHAHVFEQSTQGSHKCFKAFQSNAVWTFAFNAVSRI
jgi:hypothetical protein